MCMYSTSALLQIISPVIAAIADISRAVKIIKTVNVILKSHIDTRTIVMLLRVFSDPARSMELQRLCLGHLVPSMMSKRDGRGWI